MAARASSAFPNPFRPLPKGSTAFQFRAWWRRLYDEYPEFCLAGSYATIGLTVISYKLWREMKYDYQARLPYKHVHVVVRPDDPRVKYLTTYNELLRREKAGLPLNKDKVPDFIVDGSWKKHGTYTPTPQSRNAWPEV